MQSIDAPTIYEVPILMQSQGLDATILKKMGLPVGQETYWRGVLGHDLQPNRIYKEFTTTAKELERIGTFQSRMKQ